tara:strand:+ start:794 stop:1792 length:999 start_codon:yes stop_codon:yes gene_type:complete
MAESKLLKEAIADAKAVRETAIANAKLALEEAFTPKLQSMLSRKIEEEAEVEDEEELEEQSDSSGLGKGDNKVDQVDGGDEEKAETKTISSAPGTEDSNLTVVNKLTETEGEDEDPEEMMDMEEDEDLDLEEIIRELEGEDDEESTEEVYEDYKEDEDMEMEEDMEAPEMDAEETTEEDEDVELDLDEIIKSLTEEDEDEDETVAEGDDEMAEKEEELQEAYSTIRSLKSTINEVNLLNAKLLFSNKLFKSHNLTEGQKMKIIETLDRAQNTREVKLVYSTLAESLSSGASKKATIKEGIASRPTKSTAPTKEVIVEANQFTGRMQKLAGLL